MSAQFAPSPDPSFAPFRRPPLVTRLITAVVGRAAAVFQRVERRGGPVPDGPVLVAANHLNSLLDPLVIFRVAGRPTRPLAKAPLFEQIFLGAMLRGLGGLPVYRRQDDEGRMHRNDETFRVAIDALRAGDALQIYPEGKSHSEPALEPLRTGAARIALAAEAEAGGRLGLRIVPVGLTYQGKHRFRGRVLAEIGEPFAVRPWLTSGGSNDPEAVRALTDEIARRLGEVTLNLTREEDRPLIEAAERLYTREKAIHGYREREGLAERVPRLRRFAEALAWLRREDPERYRRLAANVRRYDRALRMLGAEEGDVPPRYRRGAVLRYVVRECGLLLLGLPFALAGMILWYPTWRAPRWVVRRIDPDLEAVATYKLATGFVAVPATLTVAAAVGGWVLGWPGALGAAVAAAVLGLVAIGWRERWLRVREEVRLFVRLLGRKGTAERMAARRTTLVAEFDRVAQEIAGAGVGG